MTDVLTAERAHLARARADLARMREHTRTLLDTQTTWGNDELTTRALTASLARRFDQLLDDGVTPLFFGRLDTEAAEVFHVGRRHVSGADGEPVVLDWRAPVAGAYYRASAAGPAGAAPATAVRLPRRCADGLRGRPALRHERGQRAAARGGGAAAQRPDARHRRDRPAGAGRAGARPARRDRLRAGGSGHRQDGRRPAPRRLPALRPPRAAGGDRRARRRPAPGVPVLRPGGPAGARRGAGDVRDGRRAGARGEGPPDRRARRGAGQGRRPGRPGARAAALAARRPRRRSRSCWPSAPGGGGCGPRTSARSSAPSVGGRCRGTPRGRPWPVRSRARSCGSRTRPASRRATGRSSGSAAARSCARTSTGSGRRSRPPGWSGR